MGRRRPVDAAAARPPSYTTGSGDDPRRAARTASYADSGHDRRHRAAHRVEPHRRHEPEQSGGDHRRADLRRLGRRSRRPGRDLRGIPGAEGRARCRSGIGDHSALQAALDDVLEQKGVTVTNGSIDIPNVAPDEGLSAPFNSWMTFFGQFFDHGLDLITKGGNGTVYIPLQPRRSADHARSRRRRRHRRRSAAADAPSWR